MRITQEADNALRIIYVLAEEDGKVGAKEIAERSEVTLRFSLKILRKLILAGLVRSYKGIYGGYMLDRGPEEISVGQVIEAIDGPINIAKCLVEDGQQDLSETSDNWPTRDALRVVNERLRNELMAIDYHQLMVADRIRIKGADTVAMLG